jgi:hypothetical protein
MKHSFRPVALVTALAGLLAAGDAAAQHAQYLFPVEEARLEQHVQLQVGYTRERQTLSLISPPASSDFTRHQLLVGLEGQVIIGQWTELSLNVPFLRAAFERSPELPAAEPHMTDSQRFGDMIAGLKVRLRGGEDKVLSVVSYLNLTLPTHSGNAPRSYLTMRGGVGTEAVFGPFAVGGAVDGVWTLSGIEGASEDDAYLGLNAYARYVFSWLLQLNLALQTYNSIHPQADKAVVAATVGVEQELPYDIETGFALRLGMTDDAWVLFGGRLSMTAYVGFCW